MKAILSLLAVFTLTLLAEDKTEGLKALGPVEVTLTDGLIGGQIITNYYTPFTWKDIRSGKMPQTGQQVVIEGIFGSDPHLSEKITVMALWDKEQWDGSSLGKGVDAISFLQIPFVYQSSIVREEFHVKGRVRVFGVFLRNTPPEGNVGMGGEMVRIDAIRRIEDDK